MGWGWFGGGVKLGGMGRGAVGWVGWGVVR